MKSLTITLMLIFMLSFKSYAEENPSDPSVKKDKEKPVAVIELEKKFPTPEASKKVEGASEDEKERKILYASKTDEISLEMEGESLGERTQRKGNRLAKAGKTLRNGFLFALDRAKEVVEGRCRSIDTIMW